ncbi:MAG TPA: shikimate kinase [Candidatus Limnocylindria bacterium]|nr:shikimate kinase [Candidatus Limnocylindria bacterium]
MLQMHVFLIGMAGSGKAMLGRKAAAALSLRLIDTDARVSEMMGMSVSAISAAFGDEFFRNAEAGVLIELVGEPPCIVCTGEGLPMARENVQLMQNHGVIIHVDRPLDQILSEVKTDRRGFPQDGSHEELIQQYNNHIGFYRAAADYTLDLSQGFTVGLSRLTQMIQGIATGSREAVREYEAH